MRRDDLFSRLRSRRPAFQAYQCIDGKSFLAALLAVWLAGAAGMRCPCLAFRCWRALRGCAARAWPFGAGVGVDNALCWALVLALEAVVVRWWGAVVSFLGRRYGARRDQLLRGLALDAALVAAFLVIWVQVIEPGHRAACRAHAEDAFAAGRSAAAASYEDWRRGGRVKPPTLEPVPLEVSAGGGR